MQGMQPHLFAKNFLAKLVSFGQIWLNLAKLRRHLSTIEPKFVQKSLDLGKFDYIWVKSKSCIPKNIQSPTTTRDTQSLPTVGSIGWTVIN